MRRLAIGLPLVLTFALCLATTAAAALQPAEQPVLPPNGFELRGSNGYTIYGSAYVEEPYHRGQLNLTAVRGNESVSYTAAAEVTEAGSVRASLGRLGRVDLTLRKSGLDTTTKLPCPNQSETYEVGTYEGVFEFHGEHGYTRARATSLNAVPYIGLEARELVCGESSFGESFGGGEPGARLAGISYAAGRTLKFRLNKNRPGGKTIFSASLSERRSGIRIHRELSGVVPASAFHYDRHVRTATISPPAPFSGRAILRRHPDAVSPFLTGNLKLAFPGHTVKLTGPSVHVSLVHARLTHGENGNISVGF